MNRTSLQPLSAGGKVAQGIQMLDKLARRLGPGSKLPTVRDLCKQMQISRATLDAALDNLELRGLLDRKHGSGLYISAGIRMRRLGLVMQSQMMGDSNTIPFYRLLMSILRGVCRKRHDLLTYYPYDAHQDLAGYGPQHLKADIDNKRVDGLIITGLNLEQTKQVQAMGVPTVMFCESLACEPRVDPDSRSTITQGVRALARCGRRRIAFIYPDCARAWEAIPVVDIFHQVLREVSAETQAKWIVAFDVDSLLRPLEGSRQFQRLWADADRPDAILSMNDEYTAGLLHAAELLEVRIPQDVMVASHANAGLELFGETEVIRIEYDPAEIAQTCLQTLDELLDGKPALPVRVVSPHVRMPGGAGSHENPVEIASA